MAYDMEKAIKKIEAIENTATFKAFIIRIWLKSYAEYKELFWDNIFKRKEATDWCLETYPNLDFNK